MSFVEWQQFQLWRQQNLMCDVSKTTQQPFSIIKPTAIASNSTVLPPSERSWTNRTRAMSVASRINLIAS
jgi:hypothetical protein